MAMVPTAARRPRLHKGNKLPSSPMEKLLLRKFSLTVPPIILLRLNRSCSCPGGWLVGLEQYYCLNCIRHQWVQNAEILLPKVRHGQNDVNPLPFLLLVTSQPYADLQAQKNGRTKFGMFLEENSLISCSARSSSSSNGHRCKEVG